MKTRIYILTALCGVILSICSCWPPGGVSSVCTAVKEISLDECEALIALYKSTDGPNWTNKTGWQETNTPCSWHAVTCIAGKVTKLILAGNNLTGSLPEQLSRLTNLTHLELDHNLLTGPVPADLYQIVKLVHFSIDQAQLGETNLITGIYVYVAAGPFKMGSSEQQIRIAEGLCQRYAIEPQKCPGQFRNEAGQNTVYVDGFWIMQTEVTNQQYGAFMNDGGYTQRQYWSDDGWIWRTAQNVGEPRYWGDTNYRGGNKPVVGVSWYEAEAYTRWLSAKTGREFRLPTEAEWEKAARGTDGRVYPWGDNWDNSRAERLNYCDAQCCTHNSAKCRIKDDVSDGNIWPAPVEHYIKGASPYGARNMAGNVAEWVADWYGEDYYATLPGPNPTGPTDGELRVVRGGSWLNFADYVRTTFRGRDYPYVQYNSLGFRVVSSIP